VPWTHAGEKPKSVSLSQNWHQGPKGINTFTPHKAPTQPTYGYEGVIYTIWLFDVAMENGPLKPPFMVGIFHGYVE